MVTAMALAAVTVMATVVASQQLAIIQERKWRNDDGP